MFEQYVYVESDIWFTIGAWGFIQCERDGCKNLARTKIIQEGNPIRYVCKKHTLQYLNEQLVD